ncbi:MAG: hypothetical protein H6741_09335 [Alphaproteobacteria bacterium]|nr:hypothetical protein [Alphaproteobacteria bacterium]
MALEEAVAADPLNLPAVAGLAVVYAVDGLDDSACASTACACSLAPRR